MIFGVEDVRLHLRLDFLYHLSDVSQLCVVVTRGAVC